MGYGNLNQCTYVQVLRCDESHEVDAPSKNQSNNFSKQMERPEKVSDREDQSYGNGNKEIQIDSI